MDDFTLTPAEVAALRTLFARARAGGWKHLIYQFSGGQHEHVWCRDGDTIAGDRVTLWGGMVEIDMSNCSRPWTVPVTSVVQIATVLELAGALPMVWALPREPDRNVTAVSDREGIIWDRGEGDGWDERGPYVRDGLVFHRRHHPWVALVGRCGPVRDAS